MIYCMLQVSETTISLPMLSCTLDNMFYFFSIKLLSLSHPLLKTALKYSIWYTVCCRFIETTIALLMLSLSTARVNAVSIKSVSMLLSHLWSCICPGTIYPILCCAQPVTGHFNMAEVYICCEEKTQFVVIRV